MNNSFEVTTPDLQALLRELGKLDERVLTGADEIIGQETATAAQGIAYRWPVDTGTSRAAWSSARLGRIRWAVINDVDYVKYIHRKGDWTILVESLVPEAIEEARGKIRQRLQKMVRSLLGKTAAARF